MAVTQLVHDFVPKVALPYEVIQNQSFVSQRYSRCYVMHTGKTDIFTEGVILLLKYPFISLCDVEKTFSVLQLKRT